VCRRPRAPLVFKEECCGEGVGVVGSARPNALITAPFSLHHAHPQEGNRCGRHSGSWEEPTGHVADACQTTRYDILGSYYGGGKVKATGGYAAAHGPVAAWIQDLKRFKFRGAGRRLAVAEQPKAGSILEPARPETAGDTSRDLTSRSTTSEPDEEYWDFDGSALTLARNRTRRSPMLTHETSPVSGASVVGMTFRVGQGQSRLPADVPGISTVLS
jgi:hypothetical protein